MLLHERVKLPGEAHVIADHLQAPALPTRRSASIDFPQLD
jgi:hypothetical protein